MKICLIEPFHTGSHATWAEEYARYSEHDVTLLTIAALVMLAIVSLGFGKFKRRCIAQRPSGFL